MKNSAIPDLKEFEVWLIAGSQSLYGVEVLNAVETHALEVTSALGSASGIPVRIVFAGVVKSSEEIWAVCQRANQTERCIGIIAWMHTFSPAKMWIRGLKVLQRPLLHLHTQFNRDIPWETIDMDFMNLNQSAHGDREFGYIVSRMRICRKVVVGHWRDEKVISQISVWMRAAAAWYDWQGARFCRFGDNMRDVAVTEGDKVEAEIRFGYSVNTFGIGDLVNVIQGVSEQEVTALVKEYEARYRVAEPLRVGKERHQALRDAARIELGLLAFLRDGGFKGFTDTFEDLHGLLQLPGIAAQRLMARGYGFAAEGDWKTAALVRALKVMGHGLEARCSFMEDYTYHFDPSGPLVLGAHMLEICESIAADVPSCEIHPLSIGGKEDPVRLVFNGAEGPAINASIVDMGDRFRLVANTVTAVNPPRELPGLPVARVLWQPDPDISTACAAWIFAGGAHHTAFCQGLSPEYLEDLAAMAGIEYVLIDGDTRLNAFKDTLRINDTVYRH